MTPSEKPIESLIFNRTESIQGQFGLSFLEQNGWNGDVVHVVNFAEVVDQSGRVQQIHAGVTSQAAGVVVIAVDAENGKSDVPVRVVKVDVLALAVAEIDLKTDSWISIQYYCI